MKNLILISAITFLATTALAEFTVQYPTEVKVMRPANSTELYELGAPPDVHTNSTWETTTGTQNCPNGTSASDSCQWMNPGGSATCDGGCDPNAWERCTCR